MKYFDASRSAKKPEISIRLLSVAHTVCVYTLRRQPSIITPTTVNPLADEVQGVGTRENKFVLT